jgi:outer membrane protein insertion porin family
VEYAGGPFGGDSQFVKYFLSAKAYYPFIADSTFSWNLLWGHVVDTKGGVVPLFERFFVGGPYSIRGFRARTLSPADPNTGELIGGNKELIGNLECEFTLAADLGIKGVVFFDGGNAWGQGEWPWHGRQLRFAYGGGLRWYSPMGPLRIELGRNLNRPEGAPRQVFEFTVGTAF